MSKKKIDKLAEGQKVRYLALEETDSFERVYDKEHFADVCQAAQCEFVLELQHEEAGRCGIEGTDDEEMALSRLLEPAGKYGQWQVKRWNGKRWEIGKLIRKGKVAELVFA